MANEYNKLSFREKLQYTQAKRKFKKLKTKGLKNEKKQRTDIINALTGLQADGDFTLYEDDECTKQTTITDLQKKTTKELLEILEEIIQTIDNQ